MIMKAVYLFFFIVLLGCSSNDDPKPVQNNALFDTKWQTEDIITKIIYGGECYQVIHFKDNENFEFYKTRNGQISSHDDEGTYSINEKVVTIKYMNSTTNKETIANFDMINSGTLVRNPKGTAYDTYVKQ